jgi:purine nucleoside phosphorylase
MEILQRINEAAAYISAKTGEIRPFAGIVLGSGLGELGEKIENKIAPNGCVYET